ncbi:hypothetical protein C8R48DRAFT_47009 [Suillus tomentosus]|nr:hypothetical protein C8R48DRAFT_47009 [Suillus tomentosus]
MPESLPANTNLPVRPRKVILEPDCFVCTRAATDDSVPQSSMPTPSSPLTNVMSRSATSEVAQLRAEIDEDLATLTESMHRLCFRRNCLAPISGLSEILTIIFEYFEEDDRLEHDTGAMWLSSHIDWRFHVF